VLAAEEVEEFAEVASVLLVNVGTITNATFEAMMLATAAYQRVGKPWVLDPVAAGATKYRTQVKFPILMPAPCCMPCGGELHQTGRIGKGPRFDTIRGQAHDQVSKFLMLLW
jgi:Hydroxyethylthiazole kinase family